MLRAFLSVIFIWITTVNLFQPAFAYDKGDCVLRGDEPGLLANFFYSLDPSERPIICDNQTTIKKLNTALDKEYLTDKTEDLIFRQSLGSRSPDLEESTAIQSTELRVLEGSPTKAEGVVREISTAKGYKTLSGNND